MARSAFQGVIPALVTPFRNDERIDCSTWSVIIDALIASGVDGLFVTGSQGEANALDPEERLMALRFCQQAAAGRVTLYGNVGCATTAATVALAAEAEDMGIDVIVVVTPYYVQLTQQELEEHFVEVCRSVRSPVFAYNFPDHGGARLEPVTVGRIAERCENLVGVKDSSGRLDMAAAYCHAAPGRELAVMVGADELVLAGLERGCAGTVNASANVAPKLYVELYRAFREGRQADAAKLQALATDLGATVGLHTFPSMMKEAMAIAGLPAGRCRRPVGPVPAEARAKLIPVLENLDAQDFLLKTARVKSV